MRLRQYHAKPKAKFRGNGEELYYLGVELEVEAPDREKRDEGLALRKRPWHFYAKRDGSLNCHGWELITHPIGKSLWLDQSLANGPVKQFFDLVRDLKAMGYSSHDGGRCGLHVHVCRKAFGPSLSGDNHYYWFSRLVNGPLFRKLSQREDESLDHWTKQEQNPARSKHVTTRQNTRYVACNVTSKTIEVRLFRGNMREDRIRKAVETVIAAIEFTRTISGWPSTDHGWDVQFTEWVQANRRTYSNLATYLANLPVEPAKEIEACA